MERVGEEGRAARITKPVGEGQGEVVVVVFDDWAVARGRREERVKRNMMRNVRVLTAMLMKCGTGCW